MAYDWWHISPFPRCDPHFCLFVCLVGWLVGLLTRQLYQPIAEITWSTIKTHYVIKHCINNTCSHSSKLQSTRTNNCLQFTPKHSSVLSQPRRPCIPITRESSILHGNEMEHVFVFTPTWPVLHGMRAVSVALKLVELSSTMQFRLLLIHGLTNLQRSRWVYISKGKMWDHCSIHCRVC